MINTSEQSQHDVQLSAETPTGAHMLKEYRAPRLRDLGKLSDLTQSGGAPSSTQDAGGSYATATS